MKPLKFLLIFMLFITAFAHAQWEVQLDLQNFSYLDRIFFLDENYGWAIGGATIGSGSPYFYTTDGGQNWYLSDDWWDIQGTDISFVNRDTGFIASGNGIIYKTINGGQNWTGIQTPTTQGVMRLFFVDENNCWAILYNSGNLLHSIDGGNIWSIIQTNLSVISDLFYYDNTIWCSGWTYEKSVNSSIIFSNDSGENWGTSYNSTQNFIFCLIFVNNNIGWAVGKKDLSIDTPFVIKTINSGEAWEEQIIEGTSETEKVNCVHFVNDTLGWIVVGDTESNNNYGAIYFTNDGGETWQQQFNYWQPICDIQMLNQDTGWAVGGDFVFYTTNGTYIPVGVEEKQNSDFNFTISPNPTSGIFTVHLPNEISNEEIIIFDIMGKELICAQNLPSNSIIDISDRPNGIYFLTLKYNTNNQFHSLTKKIIKL
jgi:photosystem II stability/assembly factor-like uncharacterized protein